MKWYSARAPEDDEDVTDTKDANYVKVIVVVMDGVEAAYTEWVRY